MRSKSQIEIFTRLRVPHEARTNFIRKRKDQLRKLVSAALLTVCFPLREKIEFNSHTSDSLEIDVVGFLGLNIQLKHSALLTLINSSLVLDEKLDIEIDCYAKTHRTNVLSEPNDGRCIALS
jgi:hypothetical protein